MIFSLSEPRNNVANLQKKTNYYKASFSLLLKILYTKGTVIDGDIKIFPETGLKGRFESVLLQVAFLEV